VLPAEHRLRTAAEFRQAVRRGNRAGGPLLTVHLMGPIVDKATSRPTRVGFVVAKAVGPAVVRNRVKRRLRHLVRDRLTTVPDGSLLVIRAHPAANGADSCELGAELDRCLERATARLSDAAQGPIPGGE
jgi:ribonuclease P protein component